MAEFFTRRGDDGTTGLLGEGRVSKSDLIMETLGTVDEATASLGLARVFCQTEEAQGWILQIQRQLYGLMAEVAATPETAGRFHSIEEQQVLWLEEQTRTVASKAPMPKEFIVPGDSAAGAVLDVARTVVRRAERRLVELAERGWVNNPAMVRYLNRLSSFLFALEIYENQAGGSGNLTLAKTEKSK